MDTPKAPQSSRARVREYLRDLAMDIMVFWHRLFDPFDPKSMPDYRKELDPDFKDEDAGHPRQPPRRS